MHRIQLRNLSVTAEKVSAATKRDIVLSRVVEFTRRGLPSSQQDPYLMAFFWIRNELTIDDRCLLRGIRVVIPEEYRHDFLDELHISYIYIYIYISFLIIYYLYSKYFACIDV